MRFSYLYAAFVFSLFLGLLVFISPWVSIEASLSSPLQERFSRSFSFPFWDDPSNDPCYRLVVADNNQSAIRDLNFVRKLGLWLLGLQSALWVAFLLLRSKELGRGFRLPLLAAYLLIFGSVALLVFFGRSGRRCMFGPTVIIPSEVVVLPLPLAMLVVGLAVTVAGILVRCREESGAVSAAG